MRGFSIVESTAVLKATNIKPKPMPCRNWGKNMSQ